MNHGALALFVLALSIRLVVVQLWTIPRLMYIPVELLLTIGAVYLERDRPAVFFLRRTSLLADLGIGMGLAILAALLEWSNGWVSTGKPTTYRWDTLLLVPVGVLIAGWRAGVYEELLFRSLAMGYLHEATRSRAAAALGQALLFWLAHIRYFDAEHHYGASTALFGLLLGILAMARRSVVPGMVWHSISNSYGAATLTPLEYLHKALSSWL